MKGQFWAYALYADDPDVPAFIYPVRRLRVPAVEDQIARDLAAERLAIVKHLIPTAHVRRVSIEVGAAASGS